MQLQISVYEPARFPRSLSRLRTSRVVVNFPKNSRLGWNANGTQRVVLLAGAGNADTMGNPSACLANREDRASYFIGGSDPGVSGCRGAVVDSRPCRCNGTKVEERT